MSLGFAGTARLTISDGKSALYAYKCENWSKPDDDPREDGEIYMELEPIASVYTRKKTKRYPKGVPIGTVENVDFGRLLSEGSIKVKNCSNMSHVDDNGVDLQAWTLIRMIALKIQQEGTFPEIVSYIK